MSPDDFRALALALPEATEKQHGGHPDFRVANKVFASLRTDGTAAVNLEPGDQEMVMTVFPAGSAEPAAGTWGARGWTRLMIDALAPGDAATALEKAWRKTAPARLKNTTTEG